MCLVSEGELIPSMTTDNNAAEELFEYALEWLRAHYAEFHFYVERDIVWTMQRHLQDEIITLDLPFRVFNDYPMLPGKRRSLSADLVILDSENHIRVAIEFKYEPAHEREGVDISTGKFPVVCWGSDGVSKDIARIREFIAMGKAMAAYAVFIDEGGAFAHRPAHPGSQWLESAGRARVLFSKVTIKSG